MGGIKFGNQDERMIGWIGETIFFVWETSNMIFGALNTQSAQNFRCAKYTECVLQNYLDHDYFTWNANGDPESGLQCFFPYPPR